MRTPSAPNPEKMQAARNSLVECLDVVESAIATLKSISQIVHPVSTIETQSFKAQFASNTLMVALSLHRLEGATRRLLKRSALDVEAFNQALRSSIPIQITGRLANTWKHGLGGQNANATVLNGVARVDRADGYKDEQGRERALVVGMLVADAKYGTFVSMSVFQGAIEQWAAILAPLNVDSTSWHERLLPKPKGPVVHVHRNASTVVPPGSTVLVELPTELMASLQEDAKNRSNAA